MPLEFEASFRRILLSSHRKSTLPRAFLTFLYLPRRIFHRFRRNIKTSSKQWLLRLPEMRLHNNVIKVPFPAANGQTLSSRAQRRGTRTFLALVQRRHSRPSPTLHAASSSLGQQLFVNSTVRVLLVARRREVDRQTDGRIN